jgi:glyoxylase-like metal-dependent hydrolase (beta-lactamase superfamily II)
MIRKTLFALALLAVFAWAAYSWADAAPDARAAIASASKALGADNLRSIEYSGSGFDFALGQAGNPSLPWPKFIDKTYTRTINFETMASRMQRTRLQGENPPRGGGQQPVVGEQNQTQVVAPGAPAAAAFPDELMMALPQGFLRVAARAGDATAKSRSVGGKKYTVISFTAVNTAPVSGYINEQNVLERVETKIYNNVLGDTPFEATFLDYQDFAGVRFPTRIVQRQGGYPVLDLTITDVKPNAPANIENPQAKGGAPPAPAAVSSEKLSDGMWLVTGGYAAIVADFNDHIVVVEGGQNDQRSAAVIAEAKKLVPGKPLRYVVNTHAHFDHAGGLRAYVAEGATVITHQINEPYFKKIWSNSHSLNPDRLAKNPRKPAFRAVGEKLVLAAGDRVIELHHMQNFGHHDGMLMAYLPKEKILLEADAFNPPPQPLTQTPASISPYHQSLLANIERLKLDVQRIIPVHLPADGRKVPLAELLKAAGRG